MNQTAQFDKLVENELLELKTFLQEARYLRELIKEIKAVQEHGDGYGKVDIVIQNRKVVKVVAMNEKLMRDTKEFDILYGYLVEKTK